jgi:anti-sigma factor RsiW
MTTAACDRIALADLTDYAAGELSAADAAAMEEHLFACADCAARAAELDALVRAIPPAVRSADVGGFATDEVLNRLARDGVHVRTFVLSSGAVVPCAVWDDDEVMALRLRANFGGASEVTMSQRVGGSEVLRSTGPVTASSPGEMIYTLSAAWVRQLPVVNVEVLLTTREGNEERTIGSYTLVHGGALQR